MKSLKFALFLAFAFSFVACSTPTVSVSNSEDESSSSRKITSSNSLKSSSSAEIQISSSENSNEKSSSSPKIDSSNSLKSSSSAEIQISSSATLIYQAVQESGIYTTKDSVAAYLCKFDKLPSNYINKSEGQLLYIETTGKKFSKWNFNPWTTFHKMIGGDVFTNREKLLPTAFDYREADTAYYAQNRGTNRLVYSENCNIYFTSDHYETFTKMEFEK